jgi:hypothetical protein
LDRTFAQVEARLACGSMVLFYLFHKKIHTVNFFVKKNGIFRPAGGEMLCRVSERVTCVNNRSVRYQHIMVVL